MSELHDPTTPVPAATRDWSPYQRAVFTDFEDSVGHTVIEAVAGSGKTTTIVQGMHYAPRGKRVLACAFNKSIQQELQQRVPRTVDVKTLHSIGLVATRRAFGDVQIDEDKAKRISGRVCLDAGLSYERRGERVPKHHHKVARLVGFAKNVLVDEDNEAELARLAIDRDIIEGDEADLDAEKLAGLAGEALRRCAADKATIDFDDMVWFPARHGLRPGTHDVVVVDETQDLNAAQLYLAKALIRKGGRIVAVGDRYQAIYAFRGADEQAMPRMVDELKARVLPLSISYRCPRLVADLAREIVPHFQHAEGAPDGVVELGVDEARMFAEVRPGDMVLSRKKAPLLAGALRVIRRGIPAAVAGRDVSRRILELIDKAKTEDVPTACAHVERWREAEIARLTEMEREDKIEEVVDLAECVGALCEGERTVQGVREKCERLFRDDDPKTRVVFSTVHKAKGLERDRVWMLGSTFRLYRGQEERNLYYVAVTRARRELRIVGQVAR